MGLNWTTSEDVLNYLSNNASARRLIQNISNIARSTDKDPMLIIHPLFDIPICLKSTYNDAKFKAIIQRRLDGEPDEEDKSQ